MGETPLAPLPYSEQTESVELADGTAYVGSWIGYNRTEHTMAGDRLVRESGQVAELWIERHPKLPNARYYAEVTTGQEHRRVWFHRDQASLFGESHMEFLF